MNKVMMMGRLTRDPEVRYGGSNNTAIAALSIAVDRKFKKEGQPTADFFNCSAFGKTAEFVEKYLTKGTKIIIEGELRNDHYKDKNGNSQYAEKILINSIEFAESKSASKSNSQQEATQQPDSQPDDFVDVPNSVEEFLPFN